MKLLTKLFTLSMLVTLLAGCGAAAAPSTEDRAKEEAAVYAAIYDPYFENGTLQIVFEANTSTGMSDFEMSDYYKKGLPDVTDEIFADFIKANDKPYPVDEVVKLKGKLTIITAEQQKEIFDTPDGKGWDVFYEKYGKTPGINSVSRVGFNKTLDKALVYSGSMAFWLAGSGNLYYLEKENGVWVVKKQLMTWIS